LDANKLKQQTFKRQTALYTEREHHTSDWMDCSDYILGARGRFLRGDEDKKRSARNEHLYNETPKQSALILAAGMSAGITSPARPWFELTTPDPDMAEYAPVRIWLGDVRRILLSIFNKSNFYNAMYNQYLEVGAFGTASMGIYENFKNVCRFEPYTIGSYSLAIDGERNVDTLYRDYSTTVAGAYRMFGKDAVSQAVRNLYDQCNYDSPVKILHAIEPNTDRKYDSPLSKDMAYRSVYYEVGADGDKYLRLSGFNERPFVAPRWSVVGEDVYATSYPGIDSIGSNKSLQIDELDKAIAVEKMHNPPLVGDSALMAAGADLIAGGITWNPNMNSQGRPGLAPVYDVNPRVAELIEGIREKEQRIQRFFYADLFLMISEMDRAQITATEIAERKEEKLLMLGPVLTRLNHEALDPIIDRVFSIAQRAGILPPPPPELSDVNLSVEYIGVLAQAQRAISTASTEAVVNFTAGLSNVWPQARHKIDPFQAIDDYSRAKGASPKIIRSDKEAQQLADDEQQQMQAQQMAEMAAGAANTAKTLGETPMGEDTTALDALMDQVA
jgi:hypothetical protein